MRMDEITSPSRDEIAPSSRMGSEKTMRYIAIREIVVDAHPGKYVDDMLLEMAGLAFDTKSDVILELDAKRYTVSPSNIQNLVIVQIVYE